MPETNDLRGAQRDLMVAVENGTFAMETPRVHVDQSEFTALKVSASNNTDNSGAYSVHDPTIDVRMKLGVDPQFYYDCMDHERDGADIVLYGNEYLWLMDNPEVSLTPTISACGMGAVEGTIKWRKAVPNGRR